MRSTLITVCWLALGAALTLAGQTTQSEPLKPTASAMSKITNADVIQLVAAGLSEPVIMTAIRQASGRDFDMSPTGLVALKKAGVSDALISAMQNPDASARPASPAADKVPSLATPMDSSPKAEPLFEFYYRKQRKGDKPPFGDYIILNKDGTFQLADLKAPKLDNGKFADDFGTYAIDGSRITFKASAPPHSKHFFSSPDGNRFEPGRIVEPDGNVWETPPARSPAATPAPTVAQIPSPAPSDGCSEIENMGLYKNEIFDRAMGGGIVEWLAKIRNNSGVTKIVIFGWRDVNGQQQRSQVQIRGGEIASPRLDMSQARAIPPVADVRVLSCQ